MVKADFFLYIQNRCGLITLKKVKWLIWDAYHLTEKSSGVVETIMVSDLPVYRRIAGIFLFRELYFSNTFTIKLISKWFAFALVLISMRLFKVFFSRQHALTLFDLITKVLRCLLFFFRMLYSLPLKRVTIECKITTKRVQRLTQEKFASGIWTARSKANVYNLSRAW